MTTYDKWKTTDPFLEMLLCPECDGPVEVEGPDAWCVCEDFLLTVDKKPCPHTEQEKDDAVCECRNGCGWYKESM